LTTETLTLVPSEADDDDDDDDDDNEDDKDHKNMDDTNDDDDDVEENRRWTEQIFGGDSAAQLLEMTNIMPLARLRMQQKLLRMWLLLPLVIGVDASYYQGCPTSLQLPRPLLSRKRHGRRGHWHTRNNTARTFRMEKLTLTWK
jgi:hypothetical protein